jgi:hypothetical protein
MSADTAIQGTLYVAPASAPRGDVLVPLRQMRVLFPDLYERHARKYADRPAALGMRGADGDLPSSALEALASGT